MDELYKDFCDPTDEFKTEPRYFCYELATELINTAKQANSKDWYQDENTIKGILLLLFTWNFAARKTKELNFDKVRQVLKKCKRELKELESYDIKNIDSDIEEKIKSVFKSFKDLMGQTGASKALSLLNPKLFVMWDTKIRRYLKRNYPKYFKGIGNGEKAENYLIFLFGIKNIIQDYSKEIKGKLSGDAIVAKKIDEYHYVKIIMNK